MRKHSRALVALILGSSMILGACGGGKPAATEAPKAAETTAARRRKRRSQRLRRPKAEETKAEAAGGEMSHDELVEAAKKEGKLVVYSTTSRVSTAAENFEKLYGIKVETANLKDGELVEKISLEVAAASTEPTWCSARTAPESTAS